MTSPRQILLDAGLRPKKALGQNFLVHEESAAKIVHWAGVTPEETVLEIGPGLGALTAALRKVGCRVVAVEKDAGLFAWLSTHWRDGSAFRLIHADALDVDIRALLPSETRHFHVVSNLPYSVSTPILEKLIEARDVISRMSLLFQEEVADRLTAEPDSKDYGRLTIRVRNFFEVERGLRITKGSFYPEPEIESRLVRLVPRPQPLVPPTEEGLFFEVVAALFQHRRKTLRNSLRDARREDWSVDEGLAKAGIDPVRRAETLTIPELLELARALV